MDRIVGYISWMQVRHNLIGPLISSLVVLATAVFIFGWQPVGLASQTMIIERFLPLLGLTLLVSAFLPESDAVIRDVMRLRRISFGLVATIRLGWRLLIMFGLLLAYLLISQLGLAFGFWKTLYHGLALGMMVGGVGLLISTLAANIILGYLVCLVCWVGQWFGREADWGIFYVFRWSQSLPSFDLAYLLIGLIALGLAIFIQIRPVSVKEKLAWPN